MEADEVEKFVQTYGFNPGPCRCDEDNEEGNGEDITECHSNLMDRFVDQCEELVKFIRDREVVIAKQGQELNVLRAYQGKGGKDDGA